MLYLELQGLTVEGFSEDPQFGEKYVFNKSTLGKAKDGEGGIRTLVVEKFLLRFPNVNPYWLILGKGEIKNERQYDEPVKVMPLDAWHALQSDNQQFRRTWEEDVQDKKNIREEKKELLKQNSQLIDQNGKLLDAILNLPGGGMVSHKG